MFNSWIRIKIVYFYWQIYNNLNRISQIQYYEHYKVSVLPCFYANIYKILPVYKRGRDEKILSSF